MIEVKYTSLCPICGKDLTAEEIENGKCHEKEKNLCYFDTEKEINQFIEFFERKVGKPRHLQKYWAKRVLNGESFAAVAPTGIGKSTFGIAMAAYLANFKGCKSYIIFPKSLLVEQAAGMLKKFGNVNYIYYHSKVSKREEFFEKLEKNDYDILITTSQFLSRNFSRIKRKFDFIFVDDVDSILKASKNIDRILHLMGFKYQNGEWKGKTDSVLMVSTATAKKGKKANLFRKLLGFDIGSSRYSVRNVVDIYANKTKISEIMEKMGDGGIIYCRDAEEAENIYEALSKKYRVGLILSQTKNDFEKFKNGEISYLIGTSHYYGLLVRGIDLPERIKYVIFNGAPVFKIKIDSIDDATSSAIKMIASLLRDSEEIKKFIPLLPSIERRKEFKELKESIKKIISVDYKGKDFLIRNKTLIIPDIRTYLQGSGRASRLHAGGLTKGASFLIENDEDAAKAFIERASYYDIEFKDMEDIDFGELKREIEESRKGIGKEDVIKPALFIVESPTKAKQIAKFFGKPSIITDGNCVAYEVASFKNTFIITASLGHITDLITDRGFHGIEVNEDIIPLYSSIKRCMECGKQFTQEVTKCPYCGSDKINDAKDRVNFMRKMAYETENIIIGTDPDAEGEKIAWDIANMVRGCGRVKRVEFHEITINAVKKALESMKEIDENRVKAQIVRRIEDRWIGFELSHILWDAFNERNLSAGRAQTPVLGWIIERWKESKKKVKVGIVKDLDLILPEPYNETMDVEIKLKERKEREITPLPPYTTETMLRDADRILHLKPSETMKIAQELFENGLITYHRTDSIHVSENGIKVAKDYLKEYFYPRKWRGKGAHECIRPTRAWDAGLVKKLGYEGIINKLDEKHLQLYDLIFRRFMASMMADYTAMVEKYEIKYGKNRIEEVRYVSAEGKSYEIYSAIEIKPPLPEGKFTLKAIIKHIPKTKPFSIAELIETMKNKKIGRPSTYAVIIDKLFTRNYIVDRGGRIMPTSKGIKVFEFLSKNYGEFISERRTKEMLERMDAVENGMADYNEILLSLYKEIKEIKKLS